MIKILEYRGHIRNWKQLCEELGISVLTREEREKQKKNRNKIANTEKEIEQIETKIGELDELLCLEEVYSNPERSKEVSQEKSNLEDRLAELYELWEELM